MIPNPGASHTKDGGSGRGQLKFKRPGEQMRVGQGEGQTTFHILLEGLAVNILGTTVFKTCHRTFG